MTISYRKLGPDDGARYREIRLESLKAHPEVFGASYEEQARMPKLMFEAAIEEPVDERFVIGAFDGEDLAGIFGYVPFAMDESLDAGRAGTLIQMYVRPAYRGQKIGLGLTKAVVEEAFRDPELEQIVLGVKEGNVRAIRVYEEAGFRTYKSGGCETERDECGRWMIIARQEAGSSLQGGALVAARWPWIAKVWTTKGRKGTKDAKGDDGRERGRKARKG